MAAQNVLSTCSDRENCLQEVSVAACRLLLQNICGQSRKHRLNHVCLPRQHTEASLKHASTLIVTDETVVNSVSHIRYPRIVSGVASIDLQFGR